MYCMADVISTCKDLQQSILLYCRMVAMETNQVSDQFILRLISELTVPAIDPVIEWGKVELSSGQRDLAMDLRCGVKMVLLVLNQERDYPALWPGLSPTGKGTIPDSIPKGGYLIPIHTKPLSHQKKGIVYMCVYVARSLLVMVSHQFTHLLYRRHNFIPHDRNTGAYSPSLCKNKPYS